MTYVYLISAIILEVIGTSALQASEQFTRPKPLILTAIGYAASFYCLSHVLRTMPVGIAYAIWAGVGVVLAGGAAGAYALTHERSPDRGTFGNGLVTGP